MTSDAAGQPLSLGSGFVVAPGLVATNWHVVADAASGFVRPVGEEGRYSIRSVRSEDAFYDVAIIEVTGDPGPPLAGSDRMPAVGDAVYAVGNPRGLEGTFSSGIVSALRQVGSDTVVQITAPISPGSSGGPILDAEGSVVGLATATLTGGQNLNFVVPFRHVERLLRSPGENRPLSAGRGRPTRASLVSQLGNRAIEGVALGQFIWSTTNPYMPSGAFSISVRNTLSEPITNVWGIVIFHDAEGIPIDYAAFTLEEPLPPGLARRTHATVDFSVKRLTTTQSYVGFQPVPRTKLELRVLGFDLQDGDS